MASAHHFEDLRRGGVVNDYADLSRLGGITRARMTQIIRLLNLAPEIQEEILYLPRTTSGFDPITTRDLRPIAATVSWRAQREACGRLRNAPQASHGGMPGGVGAGGEGCGYYDRFS